MGGGGGGLAWKLKYPLFVVVLFVCLYYAARGTGQLVDQAEVSRHAMLKLWRKKKHTPSGTVKFQVRSDFRYGQVSATLSPRSLQMTNLGQNMKY